MPSNYIDKKELSQWVRDSQAAGQLTSELIEALRLVAEGVSQKYRKACDRDWAIDLWGELAVTIQKRLSAIDPDKNGFGYITMCAINATKQHMRKRQTDRLRTIGDVMPDDVHALNEMFRSGRRAVEVAY